MFGMASVFVNLSETMAGFGFLVSGLPCYPAAESMPDFPKVTESSAIFSLLLAYFSIQVARSGARSLRQG